MKLSIIMPVYNEAATIKKVLEKVLNTEQGQKGEIIIVDDGSSDGTSELLREIDHQHPQVVVLSHGENRGKGAAMRTGLKAATGDTVLFQDTDLEYDPADFGILLEPVENGTADVVYGSRLSGGRPQRGHLFFSRLANIFLTSLTNALYHSTITDMETGYKVFRREVLQSFPLHSSDFMIEPELTAKILKRGYRLKEVPIAYSGRDYSKGKKITWWDGVKAIWALFKYRFTD